MPPLWGSSCVGTTRYFVRSLRCQRKGKGRRGGGGAKNTRKKGRGGTWEERREGSACIHAIVFFITPAFPLSNQNEAELVCLLLLPVNCLTSAQVQDFLHVGRYTNVDDKR